MEVIKDIDKTMKIIDSVIKELGDDAMALTGILHTIQASVLSGSFVNLYKHISEFAILDHKRLVESLEPTESNIN